MTITKADVLEIRKDVMAQDDALTTAEIVQGVRTMVHARLQLERPPPYPLPPAPEGKTRADYIAAAASTARRGMNPRFRDAELKRLHDEETAILAERKVAMLEAVPRLVQLQFQKERPPGIRDAHHYAQMKHGQALWEETDRIVAEALKEDSGS